MSSEGELVAELWGGETRKAVENFPVSGERVPIPVVRWLGRIKGAAALVNGELGLIDAGIAERVATAAAAVAAGEHDDQFPVDVFQTGSGTSSNMNANEVIANLAGEGVHPNDHVNFGQSSNDVFPSAVHAAALQEVVDRLLPALDHLAEALGAKAEAWKDIVKTGRTHLMDAVPVTLGQEFAGYAAQIRQGRDRVSDATKRLGQLPARRHRRGHGPQHPPRVRRPRAGAPGGRHRPADRAAGRLASRRRAPATGSSRSPARSRWWRCRSPRSRTTSRSSAAVRAAGLAEMFLPELQKGSSIMPGKVNPVIPEVVLQVSAQVIGNDTAITIGGMQGNFELNVRIPLLARNLLGSIHLLTTTSHLFADRCIAGIEPNLPRLEELAESKLQVATALNPIIGYDKGAAIVKEATATGRPLREVAREHGVDEAVLDEALDLRKIAAGSAA